MDRALDIYLNRHAALGMRPIEWLNAKPTAPQIIVVIPVLAEYPGILTTLDDLKANAPTWKARTLTILVINNRAPDSAAPGDIENNQQCINALRNYASNTPHLPLALIDASSPGCELKDKEGVGHARKAGMDWGAKLLGETGGMNSPLVCLDADTRVEENYLETIGAYFQAAPRWGAVIDYDHIKEVGAITRPGILAYELYLRYCELGMLHTNSPFAYHAIGSTMACTVTAYVSAGGMKRRTAAEDFYFLQALAKTGPIRRIWGTCAHPSARSSHRAPIGTGRHIAEYLRNPEGAYKVYHPEVFRGIRDFFSALETSIQNPVKGMGSLPHIIDPLFYEFLDGIGFLKSWEKILASTPDGAQRLRQLHINFDALSSLRAIHFLRDNAFSNMDCLMAIRGLMGLMQDTIPHAAHAEYSGVLCALDSFHQVDWQNDLDKQSALLQALRHLTRVLAYPAGLSNKDNGI